MKKRLTRFAVSVSMVSLFLGQPLTDAYAMFPTVSITEQAELATSAKQKVELQNGVQELIRGTFMEQASSFPDPNEPSEVIHAYLHLQSSPKGYEIFQDLVSKYPDSRHARLGFADLNYQRYQSSQDRAYLNFALQEAIASSKIGEYFGKIQYLEMIKRYALESGQPEAAEKWFLEILGKSPDHWEANFEYAHLLNVIGKESAEQYYLKAINVRPAGSLDSNGRYAEFLIQQGRYEEALRYTVLPGERAVYLSFLHGFVLEKLGRGEEAVSYYEEFKKMSEEYPASLLYQIQGSVYQEGIIFQGGTDGVIEPEAAAGYTNMGHVVACEAKTESIGGMRAVAYTVRQRVIRGDTVVNGIKCLDTDNSGSTIDSQYANVICQYSYDPANAAYQVNCDRYTNVTSCKNGNTPNDTTKQVAQDVYYGKVPDPYTGYCPNTGSTISTNVCSASCGSTNTSLYGYVARTPHSFLSNDPTFYTCMKQAYAVCSSGGNDNYFFYNDYDN